MDFKKKIFSNKRQLEKIVSLVGQNEQIAKGIANRLDKDKFWDEANIILNALGPPLKTPDKWARVWVDMKAKLKSKLHKEQKKFDNGPISKYILSPLEQKITEFLNFNTNYGEPKIIEFEDIIFKQEIDESLEMDFFENENNDNIICENVEVESPLSETLNIQSSESCSSKKVERDWLKYRKSFPKKRIHRFHFKDRKHTYLKKMMNEIKKDCKRTLEYERKKYYLMKDIKKIKEMKLKLFQNDVEDKARYRQKKLELDTKLLKIEQLKLQRMQSNNIC